MPIPEHPSFCHSWIRTSRARQRAQGEAFPPREVWENSAVRTQFPSTVEARYRRLWNERDSWLDILDRLPQTFCHRDAFRNNLIARRTPDGCHLTVAVDWMQTGPGHLGEDLHKLVFITCTFMRVECTPRELGESTFESYLEGLREVGWNGDPGVARLGYAANAAIWAGTAAKMRSLCDPAAIAQLANLLRTTPEAIVASWVEWASYQLDLADEARQYLALVT